MKKTVLFAAAGMAMMSFAACSGNCSKGACEKSGVDEVYTGVIPAADCDGIRCTLTLDYDDDGKDGDYTLIETYIQSDSTTATGYSDIKTFTSEGDFTVVKKDGKTYLKLVKDQKDSQTGSAETPMYFVVDSDSEITMANSDMQVSTVPGMNYTLKK